MMKLHSFIRLLFFIAIVSAVSFLAAQFVPGEWYGSLVKPSWTPPNWLFPVVWTGLYLMIAVAGWLIFNGTHTRLKLLWVVQLVFNALWSWLFFGLHLIGIAMVDSAALFLCTLLLLLLAYKERKIVFWLLLPYLFWLGYALSLNSAIFYLNR